MQPFVGLDVDGVVADTSGLFLSQAGLDPALHTSWDWGQSFGPEVHRKAGAFYADPSTWIASPVLPGAHEALNMLTQRGIGVVFISAIPEKFAALREWWLKETFGKVLRQPVRLLVCHGTEKAHLAGVLQLTHFVEDRPSTASDMAYAGINSILVPTSYTNDPAEGPIHPDVRVMSLVDFARTFTRKAQEAACLTNS